MDAEMDAEMDTDGAPEALLLVTMVRSWAEREHPGDETGADRAVQAAVTALYGGASVAEAVEVGQRTFDRPRG
jgi:hypothetical protein